MKKIGLISDTHGHWDDKFEEHFKDCDEVWHAGDIGSMKLASKFEEMKPFRAVYGNIDDFKVRLAYPEILKFEIEKVFMKILIKNIKELIQVREQNIEKIPGREMGNLPTIKNAWLIIENDLIANFGEMKGFSLEETAFDEIVDAKGKILMPTWCDSHTHLVYAGSREEEFVWRIKGLGYEEIAKNGGGILNSAKRLQNTSEEELYESAAKRLKEIKSLGTAAVEIKSGYGLTTDAELKMLRVIKRLKENSDIEIKATFLGAHAYPTHYKNDHEAYINEMINDMLPVIAKENLADYIDVFCDRGFFSKEETNRILKAGAKYGLPAKIHANELDYTGGIQVGVENALSVDHLECTGDDEIAVLLNSETMPTLLPSTAFFLKLHYPPARKMIDAGLPVSLATDYNPGSSPSGNMSFVIALACTQMGMTPEEAFNAASINAAYAMGLSDTHGSITKGKKANFILTKEMPSIAFLPYSFGSNLIDTVIINGKINE